jgi:peptidoglycan/xylan/chitin deacetylase (PgdA/CDA1 family)
MGLTKSNFYKKSDFKIAYSFDDGGENDLKVAGILEKYGLSATFYIVVDWIGKQGYLTWNQVKELEKRGHMIGSHSMTHPQDLKMVFDEQLHYEIYNSKDMIETVLGHRIDSFSYPRGRMDDRVRRFVIEAGYKEARGTGKPGITKIEDKFYLPGTIHIFQREEYGEKSIFDYAKEVIDKLVKEGGYCNIWGHSQEINENRLWKVLEKILKYVLKEI